MSDRKFFVAQFLSDLFGARDHLTMHDSVHLLFPLLSSVLFVIAATFAKQATQLGVSPYTATALSNFLLATCWCLFGVARGQWLPLSGLGSALWIALAFVGGQLSTYLAFRLGDVSLATPVFGVKIILVAFLSSLVSQAGIETKTWVAAGLATLGVIIMQIGGTGSHATHLTARRATYAILFAILAATSLSFFDIGVQLAGKRYGAPTFLTTMFSCVGLLSIGLLPWSDRVETLRKNQSLKPLAFAAILMASQAISITYSLAQYGDATRINIVYSLRGLWSVLLAWALSRMFANRGEHPSKATLALRMVGTVLLTIAVVIALG